MLASAAAYELAIDFQNLLPLLINIGIPLLVMFMPQLKQPVVSILQALLDAFNTLPTVVKSTAGPTDTQTFRAYQTLRKRCTCPEKKRAVDEAFQNAIAGDGK
jgi:hypothetical protein